LLKEQELNKGGRPEKNQLQNATSSQNPKLEDLGIEKTQSHRWQLMADIPESKFEQHIRLTRLTCIALKSYRWYVYMAVKYDCPNMLLVELDIFRNVVYRCGLCGTLI